MKAALYIRVSTKEQIENYSIPTQKERLEAYCKSKGWDIHDFYIDGGYSGSNTDRPELQRMLREINNIDVVIVYKLDRLSRSQRDTMELIEDSFLKNDVEFVSITETLDTSTPFGRAMIGILSVFAQLERENIAERMRNGHIKRAQEGYAAMGGDYDPAGYKREDGKLIIKPDEKDHIQKAFDLYEQYHSISKVQKELKLIGYPVWRFRRYRDILSNKLYIGYVSFAGEHFKGVHEPIITEEQFNRVQALLGRHKGHNAHKAKESLLSGLITCACCGESYLTYAVSGKSGNNKGKKYRYYICRARRFPSEYPEKCMNKTWNGSKLENIIFEELQHLTLGKEKEEKAKPAINYKAQLSKVNEKIERIIGLYAIGKFEREALDKQIDILNAEKERLLLRQKEESAEEEISAEELHDLVIQIKDANFNTRQATIQKLVKQIIINGEDIEIEWAF
ncbi:recombinase family protein [Paucisalibacillus globulus]|uniref:recombinase family protein n=1 Tax=Paucisalibacillus globulus TaxID=351095 RepID=UPI000BB99AF8|nr:recombinase family protein [Paucisalibacillus globulus]